MKIYTKTGDAGETSLLSGRRVSKSDLAIEAYGSTDELNCHVGLLRNQLADVKVKALLFEIQQRLFQIGSLLAADGTAQRYHLKGITQYDIAILEKEMDAMNEALPELKNFVIPGSDAVSAQAHVCRTVCRRAERAVIQLLPMTVMEPHIIQYLNRLSDYFFVLARKITYDTGSEEILWK